MVWGEEGPCDTFIRGGLGYLNSVWAGSGWCLGGIPASGVVHGAAKWWGPEESNLEAEVPQHFKVRTGHLNYKGTEMFALGPPEVPQSQGYG